MKQLLVIVAFTLFSASMLAAPKPVSEIKKSFYTTPIREFKGATFYQWKKYEAGTVATKSAEKAEDADVKKVDEGKNQTAVSAKKD